MRKKYYKTSVFATTATVSLLFCFASFLLPNLNKWAIGLTILISSYMLSRAQIKQNRGEIKYESGFKTSEFFPFWIAGIGLIVSAYLSNRLDLEIGLICLAVIQGSFNYSRGHARADNRAWTIMQ